MTRAAFEEQLVPLYEPLQRRLFMIIRDQDQAVELTQEAYERAWRAWNTFDGREPRAWLFRIGTRLALNRLRHFGIRRRVEATLRDDPPSPTVANPDLWDALGAIRALERAALLLHVLEGYSYAEIAEILGVAEGTVASLVSRANEHLRLRLR